MSRAIATSLLQVSAMGMQFPAKKRVNRIQLQFELA
jgi:hypothetical protein